VVDKGLGSNRGFDGNNKRVGIYEQAGVGVGMGVG